MFFFSHYDSILQSKIKLISQPVRILGYYNSNVYDINLVDQYYNYSSLLDKIIYKHKE
jgi:hypothetical protein